MAHGRSVRDRARPPVLWFAALGAVILTADVALVTAWISGPNLERVPAGPDQPPGWMALALNTGQILLVALAVAALGWFLVRPWVRERRITFDGLMCLAGISASIWDPASTAVQPWFAYNSYLLNYGNPLSALPGWLSLNEPGRSIAWSFPVLPAFYLVCIPVMAIMGCAVLRTAKHFLPRINILGLVAVLVVTMAVFDIVLEGIIFMPLGFWTYAGGQWPILFGGHYYQLPLNEWVHFVSVGTAFGLLRYAVNDRGQTIVERGADQIAGGPMKQAGIRLLAVIAGIHIIVFALYHIPQTFWAANSHAWPRDVTDRSYFQNQCGPMVDRACPGPRVPITRPGSGYLDWSGKYVPPGH